MATRSKGIKDKEKIFQNKLSDTDSDEEQRSSSGLAEGQKESQVNMSTDRTNTEPSTSGEAKLDKEKNFQNKLSDTDSDEEQRSSSGLAEGQKESQVNMSTDRTNTEPSTYGEAKLDEKKTEKNEPLCLNNACLDEQITQKNLDNTVEHTNVPQLNMSEGVLCSQPSNYDGATVDEQEPFSLRACIKCHTNERSAYFVPCGHILTCRHCAYNMKKCESCGEDIRDIWPAYLA